MIASRGGRRSYENSDISDRGAAAYWSFADMAVQLRLGLLSQRRSRFGPTDCGDLGAYRPIMSEADSPLVASLTSYEKKSST
jgi:hypothetical protein